ncbi:protein ANTAGONIST OF LIKE HETEROCHROMATIN PROTEIN 1-like [Dendronephthya gigantea]|uniref:protein ANTAGONIST OF LIKE HETEROCHROMATIN PROTEIN 1-like n=1 Tax=Dendronephthya gigantea TaxID=151771 RepID=UPI00106CA274|nr:protein ANTAGONIST OF LIKE HETEROCHROMATIN PROTEIN 1-like [Dendronephthya gigantea]
MRDAISAHEKLSLTLRFLAAGASYRDLAYSFRIPASTISQIVPEVCRALYECLCVPSSREQWLKIAKEFEEKWQFPHCVGAIDGKHVNIRAPPNTGSDYFNYKNHFSIVLLGVADANAQFIAFQLGDAGSQSDGGIFKHGSLSSLCKSELFPQPSCLPGTSLAVPYYLIGDEAFALDVNLQKPYPHRSAMGDEKVYNYRLSHARRIIENAFGIMCSRFRVLLCTLELDVPNAMQVVCACVTLHNFLSMKKDKVYSPSGFMDIDDGSGNTTPGSWRSLINDSPLSNLARTPRERSSTLQARQVRDTLKEYFFNEGAIDFQWKMTE